MAERILVAYATRYGSTAEVAEAIGDELRKAGVDVDVRPVDEVGDLSPYRAAVIGSPIYMGKWLPEPQVFIERNQQRLRTIPVAYFAVGLTVTDRSPEILRKAEASMDSVRLLVNPVEVGIFPGRLESSGLSFTDRTIVKMIRATTGDFRDWGAVRAWAQAVHLKIAAA
ncbi:Protoporphyrinogen IX dehydrogenase [Methanoculleus chikugoensis]|jgi:menaquinone-dependent protoporphyrinogen oxidase|uniref:Protoporphyrinogen IX dehydrogenase n=1 Tax=Methanoculleus chikugoensis TaxID=118126 RepID=A0A1M4MH89_9EURY|nr:flavodoxin domain-containing protein [Methanoculleus chikugoensis]MDD4566654.1 flavodoxin domain-containing protein [Methanoculleus chikugoensis]SCL74279.1 Protoporphyrinogen IX dehydrogenase [Methanoculleus chikugoensis]